MLNVTYRTTPSIESIDEIRVDIILIVDLEVHVTAKHVMEERDFISVH